MDSIKIGVFYLSSWRKEKLFEPFHEILVRIAYASSEGSDEPVQTHRLVRAFIARTQKVGTKMQAHFKIYIF